MPVRVGNTAITTIGKVKLGTTNITKIFRGNIQIFPPLFPFEAWSSGQTTGAAACSIGGYDITYYSNVANPTIGSIIYTSPITANVLTGGNKWYIFGGSMFGYSYQINNSGVIIATYDCMF
jgi:hypothetical protein